MTVAMAAAAALAEAVVLVADGDDEQPLPFAAVGVGPVECCPEAVANGAGAAAVVWERQARRGGGLRVSLRRRDGWARPLAVPGSRRSVRQRVQAVLADGRVVVVWQPGEPEADAVWAAVVGPTGAAPAGMLRWRRAGVYVDSISRVAVGGSFALVSWNWTDDAGSHVAVARWEGAGWTVDALPEDPRRQPRHPSVAIDRQGRALAVWWQASDGPSGTAATPVRASRRRPGRPWSTPRTVVRLRADDVDVRFRPTASFRAPARSVVSWATPWRGVRVRVRARAFVGGRWRPVAPPKAPGAVLRLEPGGRAEGLVVVSDGGGAQHRSEAPPHARLVVGEGRVALVWTPLEHTALGRTAGLAYYSLLEHGGFAGPFAVPRSSSASEASAVFLPDGSLVVAYATEVAVFTATLDPVLGWRDPVRIDG